MSCGTFNAAQHLKINKLLKEDEKSNVQNPFLMSKIFAKNDECKFPGNDTSGRLK